MSKTTQTKALLLLSGGIDSPIAGYLIKQRNIEVDAIHFSSEPFTDKTPENKSIDLAKKINLKKVFVAKIGNELSQLTKKCEHKYYYVLQRRLMWRIAEIVANKEGYEFLITGENLSQVSSQTLENMKVTDKAVNITILRPILCNDKQETIDLAKKIGTYDLSKGPEFCCVLGPQNPATKARLHDIEREEENLDIKEMINNALETLECKKL